MRCEHSDWLNRNNSCQSPIPPPLNPPPPPTRYVTKLSFPPFLKLPHSDPKLWALETPVGALVQKTTYPPMIYTALYAMFLMPGDPLLGQVGWDWALEISTFSGPKWHWLNSLMPCHKAEKKFRFPGPNPLPLALVIDSAHIKNIT
jgi:hypothetical protein